jgi:hypothetical protein
LAFETDFDPQTNPQPSHLEHASAEGGTADRGLYWFGKIATALDEGTTGIGLEQENVVAAVKRPGADHVEALASAQRHPIERRA